MVGVSRKLLETKKLLNEPLNRPTERSNFHAVVCIQGVHEADSGSLFLVTLYEILRIQFFGLQH